MLAVLATALALAGCADVDWSSPQAWFAKPLDVNGRKAGYTFSELQELKQQQRPITANDLVNGNGSCPPPAVAPAPPPAPGQAMAPAAPAADTAALLGGGVALGMSECDVVFRAGQPSSVQIGSLPNGDRTAVLTFELRAARRHLSFPERCTSRDGRRADGGGAAAGGQEEAGQSGQSRQVDQGEKTE